MAQRETADSEEQSSGGHTLPASRDSEEEGRDTAGEVADKTVRSRRNSDMVPSDLEVSNNFKTLLDPQTTQDDPDTGSAEGDGAEVVQQVKVHDHLPAKESTQSLYDAIQNTLPQLQVAYEVKMLGLQNGMNRLEKAFAQKAVEQQREIDKFTLEMRLGTTRSHWIVIRIRKTVVDVMIARAIASCMFENYSAMESHVLHAIKNVDFPSETKLYPKSLHKRCEYILGVALYYQQRFQDAADAFGKAENCPAAPGLSLRSAKEWRDFIQEALQAPQASGLSDERGDVSDSDATPTQESQTSVLALFPSRKLSSIGEEVEAGEYNNHSAHGTARRPLGIALPSPSNTPVTPSMNRRPLGEALPSPSNTPVTPNMNPWYYRQDMFQRRQSLTGSARATPSMLRSISNRARFAAAFASGRSRAGSMDVDEINAAFGGGGRNDSYKNVSPAFEIGRESWGSGFGREEISVGDGDFNGQKWAEWERWIEDEEEQFKRGELLFKSNMERKCKGQKDPEKNEDSAWRRKKNKMTPKEQRKAAEAREERLRGLRQGMTRLRTRESASGAGGSSPLTRSEDRRGSGV